MAIPHSTEIKSQRHSLPKTIYKAKFEIFPHLAERSNPIQWHMSDMIAMGKSESYI